MVPLPPDPISFFTALAAAGTFIGQSAAGGTIGNFTYDFACRALPEVRRWYRSAGQPANQHMQRSLRAAYLAATKRIFKESAPEPSQLSITQDDWCSQALLWVEAQSERLKDQRYEPQVPPTGWEPAHLVEPTAMDAEAEVAALRDALIKMLLGEWAAAGLRTPPESVTQALQCDWFDLITLYFTDQLKTVPEARAIFQDATLAKILIELRGFRQESAQSRSPAPPPPFFAPSAPDYFVGRKAALEVLAERLAKPGAVVPLTGMPGLGKTALAISFAHRYQSDFDGVYWINCAGQSLGASAAALATQLGIRPEGDPEAQMRQIRQRCAERHYLLVLDNVESNDMRALIPEGRCAVLITTQLAGLPFVAKYKTPGLKLFTPEECLDAFRGYLSASEVDNNEFAYRQLAGQLGRLPLAIAVAAGLLRSDVRYDLTRLLEEARPNRLAHGELDISALLSAAIASAPKQSRRLLHAMAVCAAADFRLSLAAEIAAIDESNALDALQELQGRSLVEIVNREKLRCRLHSLIRAEAGHQLELQRKHAEAVARRFRSWETSWRECDEEISDWRLALAWAFAARVVRSESIELLMALAFSGFLFAHRRGLFVDALLAMKSAEQAFAELGDRAGLQASYGNLALILKACGRLEEAMVLRKQEEGIGLELGDRAGLSRCYGNQALILQDWGRLEEAMALLKKKEDICQELGDRAMLSASYGNQALILKAWGRLKEAMALHQQQEAICRELGDRAGLQASYGNQALILHDWGRLEEAVALLRNEEAICQELGDRAGLSGCYGNQALILKDWGRLEEGLAMLKQQQAICQELGDRAGLSRCYGNQALILLNWGRLDEAMALLKHKEAICRELGDPAGLRASYGNQALILKSWGRLEEAMALLKQQEAICDELGDRAGLSGSYCNQAIILQMWERLEEAMALHKKQEAVCLELGNRAGLQASYGNQALILKSWGQLDDAMALHKKAEAICLELGDRAGLQRSYGNQALILEGWGRLEEAMALHKKEEDIDRELGLLGGLRITLHNQAGLLEQMGQIAEAACLRTESQALYAELMRGRESSA